MSNYRERFFEWVNKQPVYQDMTLQTKAIIDAVNVYEKVLHKELKKVTKFKAEIAMILVSDEYADKILKKE